MSDSPTTAFWNWRQPAPAGPRPPSRGRAALQVAVMAGVGALLVFRFEHRVAGGIVWALGALLLAGLLFAPRILAGFDRAGHALAHGAGTGLTWLLLTPFFYVAFGIGRLVQLLRGSDPMRRRRDPRMTTYWTEHRPLDIASRYHRQY